MKIKKYAVLGGLITAGFLFSLYSYAKKPSEPDVVSHIDAKKYMGTWYEIAHLPMYFQRKCASNTQATYQLNKDGSINVLNECLDKNGQPRQAHGLARAIDANNNKLKVTFLPDYLRWLPIGKGDYWILRIDDHYQTVLVGGPNRKYLWLLSRQRHLDPQTYQSYLNTAKEQGYDLSNLIETVQH